MDWLKSIGQTLSNAYQGVKSWVQERTAGVDPRSFTSSILGGVQSNINPSFSPLPSQQPVTPLPWTATPQDVLVARTQSLESGISPPVVGTTKSLIPQSNIVQPYVRPASPLATTGFQSPQQVLNQQSPPTMNTAMSTPYLGVNPRTPTSGEAGVQGSQAQSFSPESTSTAGSTGSGGSNFTGLSGAAGGSSQSFLPSFSGGQSQTVGQTDTPEDKKRKEKVLTDLISGLKSQLPGQFNPNQFSAGQIPAEVNMAAVETGKKLMSMLNDPTVNMSLGDFQNLYENTKQQFYNGAQDATPDVPVVDTQNQLEFLNNLPKEQQLDLRGQMDALRMNLGMPQLEKMKIDTMKNIQAINESFSKISEEINNNPNLPKGLAARRIQEFQKIYGKDLQRFQNQLEIVNQQISDANDVVDREFGIMKMEQDIQETRRQQQLQSATEMVNNYIQTGAFANFSDAELKRIADSGLGYDMASLRALKTAVKDKLAAENSANQAKLDKANNDIALAYEKLALSQERLNFQQELSKRLPDKYVSIVADFDNAVGSWENVKSLYETLNQKDVLGRFRLGNYKGSISDFFNQYASKDPQIATFRAEVEKAFQLYRKETTGAQASDKEIAMLRPNLPSLTDIPSVFFSKIEQTQRGTERAKNNLLNNFETQGREVEGFRSYSSTGTQTSGASDLSDLDFKF